MAKSVGGGMDALADATERASSKSAGLARFGNVLASLNFLQLDRIGDAMEGLADKAGIGPGGAANSIESFGVQFGQTFKQATAGLGKYGEAVRKHRGAISGAAFNLGVDAGELTTTIAMLEKTGHSVEEYGLDVRSVAGSMQAGILGGEQLTEILTSLSKSYDMGAKGAALHLDKITALGEMFGVGKDAAAGLESALQAADPVLAKFSNLKVDDVTESITRLAIAGQQRLGGKFQDRMQDAIGVFNELAGAREQMGELITGLGSDFPELAKEIGIASGDVGASMETILSDPLSFAKNMQKLMASMDQSDPRFQRLKLSLGKLPAGFNFLIQGGEDSAKALEAASQPVKNFEGSFKKMAMNSSGAARTFSEQMDLLQESFEVRLNKMTSQTDSQVVKRQAKAWKKLGDVINKLRGSNSPIGKFGAGFIQVLLDIRRHGLIHGLIPTFEKLAKGNGPIGAVFKKIGEWMPLLQGFGEGFITAVLGVGKFMVGLSLVRGPLGAVFGILRKGITSVMGVSLPLMALAGVGFLIYKNWDLIAPTFQAIWKVLREELTPAFDEFGGMATEVWEGIKESMSVVWGELKAFGKWFMDNLPKMFAKGAEYIVKAVAWVRFSIQALAIKSAASLNFIRLSWEYIATVVENRVVGAIEELTGVFDTVFGFWEMGFMKINRFLIDIPLQFSKFVQSMATKLPQKLVDMLGLSGVTKGIDQTVKYWTEKATAADDELRERQAVSDRLTQSNIAAELDRNMQEAKKLKAIDEELGRHDIAMANLELQRDQMSMRAENMGKKLEGTLTEAMARRGQEEQQPEPEVRKHTRRRPRRTPAQVQSDRMAASTPGGGSSGRAAPDLERLMLGVENAVARGSERGAARGAEAGVKKGTKRMPRPAEAGGAER